MNRPITTLFMLESLDGKINTGNNDNFDVDKDYPKINGVKEGLYQYYDLESKTDLFSLNTGRVMAKIGAFGLRFDKMIGFFPSSVTEIIAAAFNKLAETQAE